MLQPEEKCLCCWRIRLYMAISLCVNTNEVDELKWNTLNVLSPGPWFNIKMSSYQSRKSHCGSVVRSSYFHNGISYTSKMASLYWTSPLGPIVTWTSFSNVFSWRCLYSGSKLIAYWLGDGLLLNTWHTITLTNDESIRWRIYAPTLNRWNGDSKLTIWKVSGVPLAPRP